MDQKSPLRWGWLWHRLARAVGSALLLALPIGYYPENPDSTELMIGVHGGSGQIVSVLRDCSGQKIAAENNTYHDYTVSAYLPSPGNSKLPLVLGVRAGQFNTQTNIASLSPDTSGSPGRREIGFVNPNISFEWRKVGFGFGVIAGNIPASFDRIGDRQERVPISAHLRLGDVETGHFMINLMENTPLISGGSVFDIGIAYEMSPYYRGYTAISAGMYDHAGLLQQNRIRLHRYVDLDLTVRLGGSEGYFEGSVAGGIVINVGRSATLWRPDPPREKTRWERLGIDP